MYDYISDGDNKFNLKVAHLPALNEALEQAIAGEEDKHAIRYDTSHPEDTLPNRVLRCKIACALVCHLHQAPHSGHGPVGHIASSHACPLPLIMLRLSYQTDPCMQYAGLMVLLSCIPSTLMKQSFNTAEGDSIALLAQLDAQLRHAAGGRVSQPAIP